jgi:hypothetical protein
VVAEHRPRLRRVALLTGVVTVNLVLLLGA